MTKSKVSWLLLQVEGLVSQWLNITIEQALLYKTTSTRTRQALLWSEVARVESLCQTLKRYLMKGLTNQFKLNDELTNTYLICQTLFENIRVWQMIFMKRLLSFSEGLNQGLSWVWTTCFELMTDHSCHSILLLTSYLLMYNSSQDHQRSWLKLGKDELAKSGVLETYFLQGLTLETWCLEVRLWPVEWSSSSSKGVDSVFLDQRTIKLINLTRLPFKLISRSNESLRLD